MLYLFLSALIGISRTSVARHRDACVQERASDPKTQWEANETRARKKGNRSRGESKKQMSYVIELRRRQHVMCSCIAENFAGQSSDDELHARRWDSPHHHADL